MNIKSAQYFRNWYKTNIQQIDDEDIYQNENFIGTFHKLEDGKKVKGFFHMYHSDKEDIATYLPSILKIAEDGQAIYEFIQNAVDCNSTHFYIFYNEKYFLAINNGIPFDEMDIRSVLNIAQTTKKSCEKIGCFGIGFKLVHRLVGKNEGTEELVRQYKGPVIFSWSKPEDLEGLVKKDPITSIRHSQQHNNAPFLFKILLTNFPAGPNEWVRDLDYKYRILFPQTELDNLVDFLNTSLQQHPENSGLNNLSQGSLFFLQLGEGKKEKLDLDYEDLKKGVQYSMNTLKHLQKVYINNEDISKQPLELEEFEIPKDSIIFHKINPEYKECNIKVSFGYYPDYKQSDKIKSSPNFYKYFPMGDETNGFNFIVHCDSFSNESNRRKLQKDEVNKHLLPEIAAFLIQRLEHYKKNNRIQFLKLYTSLLLSDIPNRQDNDWLGPIFFAPLLNYLQSNIPTKNGKFADKAVDVKINRLKIDISLPDIGLTDQQWFEWDRENDELVVLQASDKNKLNIKGFGINEIIENSVLSNINQWIKNLDAQAYEHFLLEIEKASQLTQAARARLSDIKLFEFSNGQFYAVNDLSTIPDLIFNQQKTFSIRGILQKLGFIVSKRDISFYNGIHSALLPKLPSDKKIYDAIAVKCENNQLSAKEKQSLFQNLSHKDTKFDDIAEGTLKNLALFCSNNGQITPLSDLLDPSLNIPEWLQGFKMRADEYFAELKKFLISEKEMYSRIIIPFWDNILPLITNIPTFYQRVQYYHDLDEDKINLTKQNFVYINNEEGFLPSNEVFYNPVFRTINNFQEFRDAVYNLAQTFTPDKQVLPFLEQDPFKIEKSNLLEFDLDLQSPVSFEEIKSILEFCRSNGENFFNEYTIEKREQAYYLSGKPDTIQIWTSNKTTKEFLEKPVFQHMKLFPAELDEYKDEPGIIRKSDLYDLILDNISADEQQATLIDVIRHDDPKRKFLLSLTSVCFVTGETYDRESFEYKLLHLACSCLREEDYPAFREKIVIKANETELKLSDIPPFVDKIKLDTHDISLSKILPNAYQHSNYITELLSIFNNQELSKDKLLTIFDISAEPSLDQIYDLLCQNHPLLENEQQLAFLIFYDNDNSPFELETLSGNYGLRYTFYTNHYSFIEENSILHDKYRNISNYFTLPKEIDDEFEILKAPYFNSNGFFCPDIKGTLTEAEETDLFDFLYSHFQANEKDFENEKEWGEYFLSFDPQYCIYPDTVALESEKLPQHIQKWAEEDTKKIKFLSALGVWTDTSTVTELRKYFIHQSSPHKFRINQESRFSDEKMLYSTFQWLIANGLILENDQELSILEDMVRVVNSTRDSNKALILLKSYNLERLDNESAEWDAAYYQQWKARTENKFSIFLFEGKLPILYKLKEFEDFAFYHSTTEDVYIKDDKIYLNRNKDIKESLASVISKNEGFGFEDIFSLYHTKETEQTKTEEVSELKTELDRLRHVLEDRDNFSGIDENDVTIQTDSYFNDIKEKSEEYIYKLLKEQYPSAIVKWLNYDETSKTFNESWESHDFEILDNNGKILHYIDCKGTPAQKPTFYLTNNEWEFFLECLSAGISYQIYRVYNIDSTISYIHIDDLWAWLQTGKLVPYLIATETIKGGRVFLTLV